MYLVGVVTCRRPLRPIPLRSLQTIKISIWWEWSLADALWDPYHSEASKLSKYRFGGRGHLQTPSKTHTTQKPPNYQNIDLGAVKMGVVMVVARCAISEIWKLLRACIASLKIVEICSNFANKKCILMEFLIFSNFSKCKALEDFLIQFLEIVHLKGSLGGISQN